MRPLDHKLKYQIDKLVRTAVTGSLRETHLLVRLLLVGNIVAVFPPLCQQLPSDFSGKRSPAVAAQS